VDSSYFPEIVRTVTVSAATRERLSHAVFDPNDRPRSKDRDPTMDIPGEDSDG